MSGICSGVTSIRRSEGDEYPRVRDYWRRKRTVLRPGMVHNSWKCLCWKASINEVQNDCLLYRGRPRRQASAQSCETVEQRRQIRQMGRPVAFRQSQLTAMETVRSFIEHTSKILYTTNERLRFYTRYTLQGCSPFKWGRREKKSQYSPCFEEEKRKMIM